MHVSGHGRVFVYNGYLPTCPGVTFEDINIFWHQQNNSIVIRYIAHKSLETKLGAISVQKG